MTLISEHVETDTREKILVVAERLFRQMGYQKTTVADIAKALDELRAALALDANARLRELAAGVDRTLDDQTFRLGVCHDAALVRKTAAFRMVVAPAGARNLFASRPRVRYRRERRRARPARAKRCRIAPRTGRERKHRLSTR